MVTGVGRDGDELVGELSGAIVGLAEGLNEETEGETDERIKKAEAGVLDVLVVHLPIILRRDMTVAEVGGAMTTRPTRLATDGLRLGASDRDN